MFGSSDTLILGNAGFVQAFGVGEPRVGQVELQVEGVVTFGADVVDGDGDLAVDFLTQRSAILSLDANGVSPWFRERDVVEEENASRVSKRLSEMCPIATQDGLLIPRTLIDELLERLLGIGTGQIFEERDSMGTWLDGFAFAVEQESLDVNPGPECRLGLRKVVCEQSGVVTKAIKNRRIKSWCVCLHAKLAGGIG